MDRNRYSGIISPSATEEANGNAGTRLNAVSRPLAGVRAGRIVLSLLSGVLLFLSFPDTSFSVLAWVALVPLLAAIAGTGRRSGVLHAFVAGVAGYSGILYWIYPMILRNTGSHVQAAACLGALSAYLALFVALWAGALRLMEKAGYPPLTVAGAAAAWVALEYVRAHLFTGFPWALIGYTQWNALAVVQIAEYTGVYGISFAVVLVNVAAAKFLLAPRKREAALLFVAAAIPLTAGVIARPQPAPAATGAVTVAVVQGNIDQYKKWDKAYEDEIVAAYTRLVRSAGAKKPDIIVWPETAVPGYLPADRYFLSWVRNLVRETGTFHIVGSPYNRGTADYYNAAVLFAPDGAVAGVHLKTHLVPFGEYVPLRAVFERYFRVLASLGDFSRGAGPVVLTARNVGYGATICSENFFGDIVRTFAAAGAGILVNQTNDAWFFRTSAPRQHFIMNVFRAVENRRPVVVCGNTGLSGVVAPSGEIVQQVPLFTATAFLARVTPETSLTFYTRYGDVFALACVLAALLILLYSLMASAAPAAGRPLPTAKGENDAA